MWMRFVASLRLLGWGRPGNPQGMHMFEAHRLGAPGSRAMRNVPPGLFRLRRVPFHVREAGETDQLYLEQDAAWYVWAPVNRCPRSRSMEHLDLRSVLVAPNPNEEGTLLDLAPHRLSWGVGSPSVQAGASVPRDMRVSTLRSETAGHGVDDCPG